MKITIVYDNTVWRNDLTADWGFAAYIETRDKTILFDAGSDGHILLSNMKTLNLDPARVDMVFISHYHFDHTGGLAAFLHENPNVDVYVPDSLRGVRRAKNIVNVKDPQELSPGFYSTGELEGIEQALIAHTPSGSVVVAGCSHPGLDLILSAAAVRGKVHLVLGGFHGFDRFGILEHVDFVCPTHCSRHIAEIAALYPKKYIRGGAGREIIIDGKGVSPQ